MDNPFLIITEQLAELQTQYKRIERLLQERTDPTPAPPTRRPLNIAEAAELIGFKTGSVYQLVHRKAIPFSKIGKTLRFNEDDLLKWVQAGRVETLQEIEESARKSRQK